MSAAEKLKELLVLNDEQDDVELPIPQIVAVVEAAEIVKDAPSDYARVTLLQALAALDEALT